MQAKRESIQRAETAVAEKIQKAADEKIEAMERK